MLEKGTTEIDLTEFVMQKFDRKETVLVNTMQGIYNGKIINISMDGFTIQTENKDVFINNDEVLDYS